MRTRQLTTINDIQKMNGIRTSTFTLEEGLFKEFERNQKVTVEYNNGEILTDVKFKKVETDLRSQLCKIVEK